MKFRMLFPAVLIDFPNSKVCLMGEWSIPEYFREVLWKNSQLPVRMRLSKLNEPIELSPNGHDRPRSVMTDHG